MRNFVFFILLTFFCFFTHMPRSNYEFFFFFFLYILPVCDFQWLWQCAKTFFFFFFSLLKIYLTDTTVACWTLLTNSHYFVPFFFVFFVLRIIKKNSPLFIFFPSSFSLYNIFGRILCIVRTLQVHGCC